MNSNKTRNPSDWPRHLSAQRRVHSRACGAPVPNAHAARSPRRAPPARRARPVIAGTWSAGGRGLRVSSADSAREARCACGPPRKFPATEKNPSLQRSSVVGTLGRFVDTVSHHALLDVPSSPASPLLACLARGGRVVPEVSGGSTRQRPHHVPESRSRGLSLTRPSPVLGRDNLVRLHVHKRSDVRGHPRIRNSLSAGG